MRRRELLGGVAASSVLMGMGRPEQLLLMGGASTAPSLDLNFLSGTLDSRIAFTRASIGTYYDSTGTMQTAASGAARFDYGATPGGVTNWIRNSSMIGAVAGTPGTLPTNWSPAANQGGITRQIVGTGTEGGLNYIDIRWSGTCSDTTTGQTLLEASGATAPAGAVGQAWTFSAYVRLVSGAMTNATISIQINTQSASGGFNSFSTGPTITPTGAALNTQRNSMNYTLPANSTNLTPIFNINGTNGTAIDLTLRIGAPQLEQNTSASTWVPTSGAAANVGAVPLGLLIEESRTNSIRNSTAAGAVAGTPGTMPTNWGTAIAFNGNFGLTGSVVGTGTEAGINYIDLSISGTPNASGQCYISIDSAIGVTPSVTYTQSMYLRLTGGSMTNITSCGMQTNGSSIVLLSATPTSSPLATQRISGQVTNTGGTLQPFFAFNVTNGQAVIATFRIGLPQLELGAFATSAVPTSSVAVTRAAEAAVMPVSASWFNPSAYTLAGDLLPGTLLNTGFNRVAELAVGASITNAATLLTSTAPTPHLYTVIGSGGDSSGSIVDVYNQAIQKIAVAASLAVGTARFTYNGVTPGSTAAFGTYNPSSYTTLSIGLSASGANQIDGWIRRIRCWPRALSNSELIAATSGDAPSLDLDFVNSTTLDPRITFTRASAGTYFDATGVLQSASTNVARYDYGATPGGTTNWVRNSTMVGAVAGTPGTLPTNWVSNATAGLVWSVTGTGTESGLPYVDMRLSGTAGNSTGSFLQFDITAAAANGQTWTSSDYIKLIGGSFSNISSANIQVEEHASDLSRVGFSSASILGATSAGLSTQRFSVTRTNSAATTTLEFPTILISYSNGAVIDVTLRIGAPQLEQAAAATAWVPTSGTAVNSGALPKGLLIEEARTNSIRNNTVVGAVVGTPGTYPTNWNNVQNSGLVPNVIGFGTENGISYIDLQYSGTTAGGTQNQLVFDTGSIAASPSQAWNFSAYIRLVGGSLANVVSINLLAGDNIAPQNGTNIVPTSAALATQRQTFQFTTNAGAVTTLLNKSLIFTFSAAPVAVNLTLRIGLPQIEQGGFASSAIQTSSVAVTRAADVANMSADTSWFSGGLAPGTMGAEYLPEFAGAAASGNVHALTISDAGVANRYCLRSKSSGGPTASSLIVSGGTSAIGSGTLLTDVVGTISKLAIAWSGGAVQNSVGNGGTVQATTAPAPIASLTTVGIANLASGNFSCGWTRRVRYWPRMLPNTELQSVTT